MHVADVSMICHAVPVCVQVPRGGVPNGHGEPRLASRSVRPRAPGSLGPCRAGACASQEVCRVLPVRRWRSVAPLGSRRAAAFRGTRTHRPPACGPRDRRGARARTSKRTSRPPPLSPPAEGAPVHARVGVAGSRVLGPPTRPAPSACGGPRPASSGSRTRRPTRPGGMACVERRVARLCAGVQQACRSRPKKKPRNQHGDASRACKTGGGKGRRAEAHTETAAAAAEAMHVEGTGPRWGARVGRGRYVEGRGFVRTCVCARMQR